MNKNMSFLNESRRLNKIRQGFDHFLANDDKLMFINVLNLIG